MPEQAPTLFIRQLADQAFSRASGAPLREGNRVRILRNAAENYPAWLQAIEGARSTIHFEMYIIHEDDQGRLFQEALLRKASDGVAVRVLYDWMGGFGKTSRRFWNRLRAGGVDVRCYNPPRFDRPFGWVSRDHRKMISVDRSIAFVTGLCVGRSWVGDPQRGIESMAGYRDRSDRARPWTTSSRRSPRHGSRPERRCQAIQRRRRTNQPLPAGVALRVVATVPNTAGMFRVDQLVAAMARHTLWMTDAYYAGTTVYVQALRAAATRRRRRPPSGAWRVGYSALRPFSRAGYRPLLEAGVRVFEWNGSMLHAKTAVADGRWARVGSTNLNIASWMGNRELDVIIEDEAIAGEMGEMFQADLENATEVVLDRRNRVRAPGAPREPSGRRRKRGPRDRRSGKNWQHGERGDDQSAGARARRGAHRLDFRAGDWRPGHPSVRLSPRHQLSARRTGGLDRPGAGLP